MPGQLVGDHAADPAGALDQGVDPIQLRAAVQHGLYRPFPVHAGAVAPLLVNADRVHRAEQPGHLIHVVQKVHEITFMGHGGTQVMDPHQAAGVHELRELPLFDLTGEHDRVHVQTLKKLVIAAWCIGLSDRVAHIEHQLCLQVQSDIFQFHRFIPSLLLFLFCSYSFFILCAHPLRSSSALIPCS